VQTEAQEQIDVTITNGYCTLAEARAQIGITVTADTTDDTVIEARVEAISRTIDALTGRRFYRNGTDEVRYYTSDSPYVLECPDDIGSITTLKTDDDGDRTYEHTWAATDFDLMPYNASLDSKPYTWIETTPDGDYVFPSTPKGVQITGKFGYAASTPPAIKAACLLATQKLFKRKDAPFGVEAGGDLGIMTLMKTDPDLQSLLTPFIRNWGAAV
jgi:hypothetical protein